MYDVKLDRLDVAIKAILTLYARRQWRMLEELGFEREQAASFEAALAASDLPVKQWREVQVFAATVAFPALVDGAVLIQARYQAKTPRKAESA